MVTDEFAFEGMFSDLTRRLILILILIASKSDWPFVRVGQNES